MILTQNTARNLFNPFHPAAGPQARSRRSAHADGPASSWAPAADIREAAEQFVIHLDLPGVQPEHIDITMDQGVLNICGERQPSSGMEQQGFIRSERIRGKFARRFNLPDTVDADNITASSHHGVLCVVIPKQKPAQPRRIAVQR